jgi:hypothetical protein
MRRLNENRIKIRRIVQGKGITDEIIHAKDGILRYLKHSHLLNHNSLQPFKQKVVFDHTQKALDSVINGLDKLNIKSEHVNQAMKDKTKSLMNNMSDHLEQKSIAKWGASSKPQRNLLLLKEINMALRNK